LRPCCWLKAGEFEAMAHNLWQLLCTFTDPRGRSTAVILESRKNGRRPYAQSLTASRRRRAPLPHRRG
jgi:hypothetical protein